MLWAGCSGGWRVYQNALEVFLLISQKRQVSLKESSPPSLPQPHYPLPHTLFRRVIWFWTIAKNSTNRWSNFQDSGGFREEAYICWVEFLPSVDAVISVCVAKDSRDVLMTRLTLEVVNEKENETATYYVVSGLICIQSSLPSFHHFWFLQYVRCPHPFFLPLLAVSGTSSLWHALLKIFFIDFFFSF